MGWRRVAERLSRGVVLRRRLPPEFGSGHVYISPESTGLRAWRRNLYKADPAIFDAVQEFVQPNMSVWDIGANIGLFMFPAAFRAGSRGFVLGVEPDVDNVALLQKTDRSLDRSRNATTAILAAAVSRPGSRIATFRVSQRARSTNALDGFGFDDSQTGGVRQIRHVPLVTLDELLGEFPKPDLIKIDVEGAELLVLEGGSRVLREARPRLLIEVSSDTPGHQEEAARILHNCKYRILDAAVRSSDRRALAIAPFSCLALPDP